MVRPDWVVTMRQDWVRMPTTVSGAVAARAAYAAGNEGAYAAPRASTALRAVLHSLRSLRPSG